MSGITSLGVGSGMDLESLVSSMVSLKKSSKVTPISNKEALKELQVTGLSNLKSTMTSFNDYLKTITDGTAVNKRTVETTLDKEHPDFSYELDTDVSNCSHDIAVTQLAQGTKLKGLASSDNFFSEKDTDGNTVYRSKNAGQFTFTVGSGDDAESFSIDIAENESLTSIIKKINGASGNESVSMNYIVGSDGNINIMLQSSKTGDGNDLRISGDVGILGMTGNGADNEVQNAQNAKMQVDGIEVSSSTNKFSDQISGLDFTAKRVSEKDDQGNYKTSNITISEDSSGMKDVVNGFVSKFQSVMSVCDKLSAKNTYTNGKCNYDGGDLAGDPICNAIKSSLKDVINNYTASDGKTLYQMGISIDKSGKLSVDSKKLGSMMDNDYEGLISVMQDLSSKLTTAVENYTKSGTGILTQRSESANNEWKDLKTRLSTMDDYMTKYEERLRKKYTSLDSILANMNSNMSYITAMAASNTNSNK